VAKKTVIAQIEFGMMDEDAIHKILDGFAAVTETYGKCQCFDVWRIEVDGEERDPDSPQESLW
jgi:hypothetical protein